MASKCSEYKRTESGGVTVFEVTPAPAPKFWFAIIFGGFCVLVGLGIGGGWMVFWLPIGAFFLWLGWTRDLRRKGTRGPMSFKVTPDSIEASGQTFKKADIHRLILKNSIADEELPGISRSTTSTAGMAGMMFRAQASTIATTLNVETGGKSTVLAAGMDNTTAYGLLTDVSRDLGLTVS